MNENICETEIGVERANKQTNQCTKRKNSTEKNSNKQNNIKRSGGKKKTTSGRAGILSTIHPQGHIRGSAGVCQA